MCLKKKMQQKNWKWNKCCCVANGNSVLLQSDQKAFWGPTHGGWGIEVNLLKQMTTPSYPMSYPQPSVSAPSQVKEVLGLGSISAHSRVWVQNCNVTTLGSSGPAWSLLPDALQLGLHCHTQACTWTLTAAGPQGCFEEGVWEQTGEWTSKCVLLIWTLVKRWERGRKREKKRGGEQDFFQTTSFFSNSLQICSSSSSYPDGSFPRFSMLDSTALCHHFSFYCTCLSIFPCHLVSTVHMCLAPPAISPSWFLLSMCPAEEFLLYCLFLLA